MSLRINSDFNGVTDPDAGAYIAAVEAADGNQLLEFGVGKAINDFVVGCKADGIWDAIKASCILAGARTTNGALIPLKGTAPTPVNFDLVNNTDYNRKTGLVGDGSTKYLDCNRNNNADPQNNQHLSAYVTEQPNPTGIVNYVYLGTNWGLSGSSAIGRSGMTARPMYAEMRYGTGFAGGSSTASTGFFGASISSGASFSVRYGSTTSTQPSTSSAPRNENIFAFRNGGGSAYAPNRMSFYSIGEAIDLQKLDARVTALITAFGAAIP